MPSARRARAVMTVEEYLAMEEASPVRHEYVRGEVHAMSGSGTRHNLITLNIYSALRGRAKRSGCKVFVEAVKVRAAADVIYYPDVVVACGAAAEVALIVAEPCLVVEVTSPSTRATDRREKLVTYQGVRSLRGYLIVEQKRRYVIAYTRAADGTWPRRELTAGGVDATELPCPATRLSLDEIYEGVELPPLAVGEELDESLDEAEEEREAWAEIEAAERDASA